METQKKTIIREYNQCAGKKSMGILDKTGTHY